eukprot:TRINITY_DN2876_c3_g1_i1.p1 TRINITY_DN2876_c3_g1~~TRINITY_DN2876_c3_g1_i1.p1  ORF type:complete len:299 (+),score=106.09 TRINITY_DN2876_c3_g1_i1:176-1072(+)
MHAAMQANPPKSVFGYQVGKPVGAGIGGQVFMGFDKKGKKVAIKFAPMGDYMALAEVDVYRSLKAQSKKGAQGFPRLHWYGHTGGYSVLVMDYLDTNVAHLRANRPLRGASVLEVGRQVLRRLRTLHAAKFIHSDLKPENIMVSGHTVFLIDFGLSKAFVDPITNEHVKEADGFEDFSGSPNFASINAHRGTGLSRRDDLESLVYVLIHMYRGSLPWEKEWHGSVDRAGLATVAAMKASADPADLCKGTPQVIRNLLDYSRSLCFSEDPDYDLIDSWFTSDLLKLPETATALQWNAKL